MNFSVFVLKFKSEAVAHVCFVKNTVPKNFRKSHKKNRGKIPLKFKHKLSISSDWKIKNYIKVCLNLTCFKEFIL